MRPIAEIDPQACRALQGVVFDVDDTLTRGGRLEAEAYAALWALQRAGLLLVAVTGRPIGFAELMARQWPVNLAVGENGAGYVRVTERELRVGFFEDDAARGRERELLQRVAARMRVEAPWAQVTDDHWARRCDLAFDVGERVTLSAEQIEQVVRVMQAEGARTVVSSVHAHAMLGSYDKASGVVRACQRELNVDLAVERARWLFVGDSGNDAAAFAFFPLSAAVANVTPHLARLPVAPAYVSEADRGLGFAEIARTVLERR
ncbi:MAG TPA: HAD-IIB family hydrolase [Polyangiales bacterium]|jgi:HAD superfamily hydrolase (TIGR01484 family)